MPPRLRRIALSILVCDEPGRAQAQVQQAFDDAHIANALRFVDGLEHLLDFVFQRGVFGGETGAAPRPGLMLLSLRSPNGGARDALATIRAEPALREIAIVVLVGSLAEELEVRRFGLGLDTFITKPVTMPALLDAIRRQGRHWIELVERVPEPA